MEAKKGRFRGTLFGGFHRQDVLDYLEVLNREHRQALEDLRTEQEDSTREAMAEREEEIAALKQQISALLPQAESWQRVRESAGDITVAAHVQARTTLETANRQAARIRAESASRIQEVQETLHRAILAAEEELNGARAAFRRAEDCLQGLHTALSGLVEQGETGELPEDITEREPCPHRTPVQTGEEAL